MRPPGAGEELSFSHKCDGCAACVQACETHIIQLDSKKRPFVSFLRAGCTFCGRCIEVCEPGALSMSDKLEQSFAWRAEVASNCLDKHGIVCRACESSCEENAIRFRPLVGGKTDVTIRAEACNGCGACVSKCPSKAISLAWPKSENSTLKENAA
jgi:ferredoxin-type protein NapF